MSFKKKDLSFICQATERIDEAEAICSSRGLLLGVLGRASARDIVEIGSLKVASMSFRGRRGLIVGVINAS